MSVVIFRVCEVASDCIDKWWENCSVMMMTRNYLLCPSNTPVISLPSLYQRVASCLNANNHSSDSNCAKEELKSFKWLRKHQDIRILPAELLLLWTSLNLLRIVCNCCAWNTRNPLLRHHTPICVVHTDGHNLCSLGKGHHPKRNNASHSKMAWWYVYTLYTFGLQWSRPSSNVWSSNRLDCFTKLYICTQNTWNC